MTQDTQQYDPVAERLTEIQNYVDAATPGPWSCWNGWRTVDQTGHGDSPIMGMARIGPEGTYEAGVWTHGDAEDVYATLADAEFIAAARTHMPALLAFARDVLATVNIQMARKHERGSCAACDVTEVHATHIRDAANRHLGGEQAR